MRSTSILASLATVLALTTAAPTTRAAGALSTPKGALAPISTFVHADVESQVTTSTFELRFTNPAGGPSRLLLPLAKDHAVVGLEVFREGAWDAAEISNDPAKSASSPGAGQASGFETWLGDDAFAVDLPDLGTDVRVRVVTLGLGGYEQGQTKITLPLRASSLGPGGNTLAEVRIVSDRAFAGFGGDGPSETVKELSQKDGLHTLELRYEGVVSSDLHVKYAVDEPPGLDVRLVTDHTRCQGEDGFFLLVVRPAWKVADTDVAPRVFQFVMDRSGSMAGPKMQQAKQAATLGVSLLGPADDLNVVTFSNDVTSLFPSPLAATGSNKTGATNFIAAQMPIGSTNISDALTKAVSAKADPSKSRLVVFLTDGQPTAGITDPGQLATAVSKANASGAKIYAFGVGADVNKTLLTSLATGSGGEARFLANDADLMNEVSGFLTGIAKPVLVDAKASVSLAGAHDVYPEKPQELFAGRQLLVLGRFPSGGDATVTLSGKGALDATTANVHFPDCSLAAAPFLPRLWAKSKIDALTAKLSEPGADQAAIVAEIQALSKEYGIESDYAGFSVPTDPTTAGSGSSPGGSYGGYDKGGLDEGGCSVAAPRTSFLGAAAMVGALAVIVRRRARRS